MIAYPDEWSFACWFRDHADCRAAGCSCPCHEPADRGLDG